MRIFSGLSQKIFFFAIFITTFFGTDHFLEIIERNRWASAKELTGIIAKAIAEFVGDAEPFDDITLVIISRTESSD